MFSKESNEFLSTDKLHLMRYFYLIASVVTKTLCIITHNSVNFAYFAVGE